MSDTRIFKYPLDIDADENIKQTNSAYMIISAFPYDKSTSIIQKNNFAETENNKATPNKTYKFHFITYVPKELQYSNAPSYKDLQALALADPTNNFGKIFMEVGFGIVDTLASAVSKGFSEGLGIKDYYKTTKDTASILTGVWEDPRMVNVFQAPANVNQTFSFTLMNHNETLAKSNKTIALCFKYSAQPHRVLDSKKLPFLGSPFLYDITVVTPAGLRESMVREYSFMNLKSVNVKPLTHDNRLDVPYYSDGNVIGYELKLDFSSMHPVIRPNANVTDDKELQDALDIIK